MRNLHAIAAACVALGALAMSACGSDDSSDGGDSGSAGTAAVGGAAGNGASGGAAGSAANGGTVGVGGSAASSGTAGIGGSAASGGSGGAGGTAASGGTAGVGGSSASGGSSGTGGDPECPVSCEKYPLLAKAIYSDRFAIDDTHVYYGRTTVFYRVPNSGGPAEQLASPLTAWKVVVRGGTVYGMNHKYLARLPVTGGTPSLVFDAANSAIHRFALDDTHAYVTDTVLGLAKVPLTGGSATTLVPGDAYRLAVDATHVFYEEASEIRSVPLSGGSPTLVTSAALEHLLVDDNALYFVELDQIYRISKDGSNKTQLSGVPGHTKISTITQDATNLYVGTADPGCNAIAAIPKAGGPAKVLADDIVDRLYWIEVDPTHIYFQHRCHGTRDIRRMAR